MTDENTAAEYVIVGDRCWARGATQEAAKTQLRTEGGRLSSGFVMLYFDGVTSKFETVSPIDGAVSWTGQRPIEVARHRAPRRRS